jgi:hypothetical protein
MVLTLIIHRGTINTINDNFQKTMTQTTTETLPESVRDNARSKRSLMRMTFMFSTDTLAALYRKLPRTPGDVSGLRSAFVDNAVRAQLGLEPREARKAGRLPKTVLKAKGARVAPHSPPRFTGPKIAEMARAVREASKKGERTQLIIRNDGSWQVETGREDVTPKDGRVLIFGAVDPKRGEWLRIGWVRDQVRDFIKGK